MKKSWVAGSLPIFRTLAYVFAFGLINTAVPPSASADELSISIPIQLTHAQNFDAAPSPDGKKLVFISVVSGKEQLFTMDSNGSNSAQLTRDDADHEDPAWSADGTKIAFVQITKERTSIAVMNVDGMRSRSQMSRDTGRRVPNFRRRERGAPRFSVEFERLTDRVFSSGCEIRRHCSVHLLRPFVKMRD